jgi:hypothetical protein
MRNFPSECEGGSTIRFAKQNNIMRRPWRADLLRELLRARKREVNPSFQNSPLRKFPFSLNSHLQPVLSGRVYPADFFRLLSFAQIPFEIPVIAPARRFA